MSKDAEEEGEDIEGFSIPYSVHELRAFQRSTAALIMPDGDGWKVIYLSGMDFTQQRGTPFATLEEAMAAIAELLPVANSDDQKDKARDMEEILWLRLQLALQEDEGRDASDE